MLLALLTLLPGVWAQEAKVVPASEAARHLRKGVPPQYPNLAQMARIQGKVALEFTIAPDGGVTQLRGVSGHPMLLAPALDAVRRWTFDPFLLNGTAVPVRTYAYLLFALGPQAQMEQNYFAKEIECRDLLSAKRFDEAGKSCNAALETAKKLGSERFGFKTNAYGNAGLAAYHLNLLPEALQDFQVRLKLAKSDLPPENEEWFDVHHDLALAFQASGQMELAESEYRETERALKTEIKALQSSPAIKEYVDRRRAQVGAQMQQSLTEHAALLRQMGRGSDADKLDEQAKSLLSSK